LIQAGIDPDCMDVNTSEQSRRGTLDHCLALIDGYEKEEMRTRTWNTIHQRTPEEIKKECDSYRRRAHNMRLSVSGRRSG